jgi:alkanesulfonate monooxygenase SsuD/methylene tetrahydromethanopterin reductase-like flavin-dependent oxidoreductase (luciferase family)
MNASADSPIFGINIDPSTTGLDTAQSLARLADKGSVDLLTIQDHPYNPDFLDTWTLLTTLASRTERVHFMTNMLNTPLRPPAMMAKMAATLDVISAGRLELGLGAGGYEEGMQAWDGTVGDTPGERYQVFSEYLTILRGMLENATREFSFHGKFHQVKKVVNGPAPAHRIPLWIGAGKPRMLRLAGSKGDGWIIGTIYILPDQLDTINSLLDEGAIMAGRKPEDIHRGYNLFGVIQTNPSERLSFRRPGIIQGSVSEWVETILHYHQRYRHDTFIFWPVAGDAEKQAKIFLDEIMPEVRAHFVIPPKIENLYQDLQMGNLKK